MALIPVDGKEGPADVCVIELGGTIGMLRTTDAGVHELLL